MNCFCNPHIHFPCWGTLKLKIALLCNCWVAFKSFSAPKMLLLYLQDADLNVKRLKMLALAEIVLSGDGQEGCTLFSAVWQQGHWLGFQWFKCLLWSNTCLAQKAFPVLFWRSSDRYGAGCNGPSSSLQEQGQALCSPALKSCPSLWAERSAMCASSGTEQLARGSLGGLWGRDCSHFALLLHVVRSLRRH